MTEICFPRLKTRLENLRTQNESYLTSYRGCVELFCIDCDFYKEEERELECGAFKMLRFLMKKRIITPGDIFYALEK